MTIARVGLAVLAASLLLGGCSGFGKSKPPPVAVDPNTYPANYKSQIVSLLNTTLTSRPDFHAMMIAEPALRLTGEAEHYVVCLRLNVVPARKDKVVIFLNGVPNLLVDATPEQCADVPYQPFRELEATAPR